ncbi:ketopantoate reductase family protein [Salinisphaera hydrothermalis]|uniref:2-dehydropantoate 2-reductase n=1 Tax=Salinisphaera hydrothermalis (strain C41B8) TaxID=1304275 RepID=A0A084IL84_SALHC|nr:ketopantoate reductase family protein [Salinisphaera hydrothermalis]KEZ77468.1 2-dehydropantoate 2-reductase [Salinisphaera hydrothermalis C41B8]
MRIGIFGAGGVGGYFGARWAAAGHDVTFVARGAHLAALQKDGLVLHSPRGDLEIDTFTAVEDIDDAPDLDLVMIAVKLWSTEEAVRALRARANQGTAIASFQNGVTQYDVLRRELPEASLLGGIAFISATIEAPGVIRHHNALQSLKFGEFDGRESERVKALKAACDEAGIEAEICADIESELWQKFVFLTGLSGATAVMRQPIGPIRENRQTRSFLYDLMNEVVAVGRARDIDLPEDFATDRLAFCDGLPGDMRASMAYDLANGNRLELPWLSGAVADYGHKLGIATPRNQAVADILALYTDGAPSQRAESGG